MKKKLISGLLASMMVLSIAGCGNSANSETATTKASSSVNYNDYITLIDYKNMEVEASPKQEVTDEDIQDQIDLVLENYSTSEEVYEGVVEDGDTINMDYSGLLDGVAFSGGTATDTTYTVGGNFIESLDRQLIGLEVGKEYNLDCTFPANYGSEELAGKDVVFVVTVNYIEKYTLPNYTDEFIQGITQDTDEPLNTVAEFEASVREYLEESYETSYNNAVYAAIMKKILDESEIKGVPEDELTDTIALITDNAQAEFEQLGSYFGFEDFESYLTGYYGYSSADEFYQEAEEYATEYIYEKMVLTIVTENEGITVTQDEIDAYIEENATSYGYESAEDFRTSVGETIDEEVGRVIKNQKASEALIGYVTVVNPAE